MPVKGPSAVHLVIATWKMSVLISLLWLLDYSQSFTAVTPACLVFPAQDATCAILSDAAWRKLRLIDPCAKDVFRVVYHGA